VQNATFFTVLRRDIRYHITVEISRYGKKHRFKRHKSKRTNNVSHSHPKFVHRRNDKMSRFLDKYFVSYLSFNFNLDIKRKDQEIMPQERTLSIIKPDSVSKNNSGAIIAMLEKAGLHVIGAKMLHLSKPQAEAFYAVHKERPFFGELVSFMIQGPVIIMVLEGENAVQKNRDIMGATDPKKAAPGTIRALFGAGIESNAVHGSDSLDNAKMEIDFFFKPNEILSRAK
jgi:nucleoside-diphosphate kinase